MSASLPDWYKHQRQQSALSIADLGRRLGVDGSLITHIEAGRRCPSPRHLQSFLNLLGASADERAEAWRLLAEADASRAGQRGPQAEAA